jgi:hypothetical protein
MLSWTWAAVQTEPTVPKVYVTHALRKETFVSTVIAVVGAGACDARLAATAERVGAMLGTAGFTVACGGLGGVMEAVCRGAREHGGSTIGILPGADRTAANPYVDIVLPTGMGEARNLLVVRAGHAVLAIGGGFGTLSEVAFARKLDIPVVGLHTWRLPDDGIIHETTAESAVARVVECAGGSLGR